MIGFSSCCLFPVAFYSGSGSPFLPSVRLFSLSVQLIYPAPEHFPTFASLQATYMKIA